MNLRTQMNRLHNATNPAQGVTRRVLCVCSAGLLRSPTTAEVLRDEYGYNTRACGLSEDYALIAMDPILVAWADEIVCMTQEQADEIRERFAPKPLQSLDIEDDYYFRDAELIALIRKNYVPES
jgi:predicted protein tyrosine phosphatase